MNYQILPVGSVWNGGMFFVPQAIADKYLKLASEYQLKALLYLLGKGGAASSAEIAKKLGITGADAENIMDFWVAEGILVQSEGAVCESTAPSSVQAAVLQNVVSPQGVQAEVSAQGEKPSLPKPQFAEKAQEQPAKREFKISPPVLTPAEIDKIGSENAEIANLLNEAQVAFGHTLSHCEMEMTVNLVSFYGMLPEVVLMLITYCKEAKEAGKRIGSAYLYAIAKNWLEQGITTVADAEARLCEAENAGTFWHRIRETGGFVSKSPTEKQLDMIMEWRKDHSDELILHAASEMREAIDKPNLKYMNTMLARWKKAGITTVAQAKADSENYQKQKENRAAKAKSGEISRKPTYDLDKIKKNAQSNTEIKF